MFYNGFSQYMCRDRSRLFFRNKYTTTRLRSPANMFLSRIFVLRYNSTLSDFFHSAFHRLLLFTKKYFSHQSFRTSRLRYEINTTKTKPNKSLHFFDAGKVSVTVRQTIQACSVRKTSFKTRKRFATNNTRPNQKISCLNQSALVFT